jgi:DNA-binding response OmpR family regulator
MPPKKVLITDDSDIFRSLVEAALGKNYDILQAHDGVEACEIAKEELPDIIIMDLVMPRMSGINAIRELRSNESTSKLPVIALTSAEDDETKRKALRAGFTDYIIKPFDLVSFKSKVEELLGMSKSEDEESEDEDEFFKEEY